jgi:hypothetical protein
MSNDKRQKMTQRIEEDIRQHGYHTTLVTGGDASPRFAYTIGLSSNIDAELIFAGASFYSSQDVFVIIDKVAEVLSAGVAWQKATIEIDSLGCFSLCEAHSSWINMLLLGALDYYNTKVTGLQIVPDQLHMTIDVPKLFLNWDPVTEPVWQWLSEPWGFPIAEQSIAITNIAALQGEMITEVMRWEEREWELFAGYGPDVSQEDLRKIPLGTLLAVDQSLHIVTKLDVGKGLWRRHNESEWHSWE